MDKIDRLYLELMPIATGFGAGYEAAQGDWLKVTCYSILTAMFVGENVFRRLNKNSEILEERV